MLCHFKLTENLRHYLLAVFGGGVRWQPQLGGVHQRLIHRQLPVHHIVLGHHPDPRAQRGVVRVDVVALEGDGAARRMGVTGDQPRQGGFTRTGWADDRGQGTGPGGQRDVIQQRLVVLDGPRHAAYIKTTRTRRGLGPIAPHQGSAGEDQVDVADGDDVAVGEKRRLHPVAVDECPVDRPVVGDLGSTRGRDQGGVMA